jgi:signal peptidase I
MLSIHGRFYTIMKNQDFFTRVQLRTETILTQRKIRRRINRENHKKKNPVLDWVEDILWAVGMVLVINQYIFQAYQIPSGSMIDTLLIGDRIFVNKLIYGPELLPGIGKLPSPFKPQRNEVIIFENPSYISSGPFIDILQRVIYMLTLSLVDIDKDENGEPKAHFLIKRAVGVEGDRLVMQEGEMQFLFPGETQWISEREYLKERGTEHTINRLMKQNDYPVVQAAGKASAFSDLGLQIPVYLRNTANTIGQIQYPDFLEFDQYRLKVLRTANPQEQRYTALATRYELGWYVPKGRIFPMGDNRDNSRDARYFGAIQQSKVLGRGAMIYWPPSRFGVIK